MVIIEPKFENKDEITSPNKEEESEAQSPTKLIKPKKSTLKRKN